MPSPLRSIPGGATTQVAQQAGNPEYVGLSSEQAQQARDRVAPQEPIPVYDSQNYPEYGVEQDSLQQEQSSQMEWIDITLPSGEEVELELPVGMSDTDVKNYLLDIGEGGFEPDGDAVDRFIYGARQGDNITDNAGDWAKSHFALLADEFYWGEDGLEYRTAGERYGEDYYDMTPQQRRERISEVDAAILADDGEAVGGAWH